MFSNILAQLGKCTAGLVQSGIIDGTRTASRVGSRFRRFAFSTSDQVINVDAGISTPLLQPFPANIKCGRS